MTSPGGHVAPPMTLGHVDVVLPAALLTQITGPVRCENGHAASLGDFGRSSLVPCGSDVL